MAFKFRKYTDGIDRVRFRITQTLTREEIEVIRRFLKAKGEKHGDRAVRDFVEVYSEYSPPDLLHKFEQSEEEE